VASGAGQPGGSLISAYFAYSAVGPSCFWLRLYRASPLRWLRCALSEVQVSAFRSRPSSLHHKHPEYNPPSAPPSGWSGGTLDIPWTCPIPIEPPQTPVFDQPSLSNSGCTLSADTRCGAQAATGGSGQQDLTACGATSCSLTEPDRARVAPLPSPTSPRPAQSRSSPCQFIRRGRNGTAEMRGTQPHTTPQTNAGGINRGIRETRVKQTSSPSAFGVFRVFRGLSPSRNSSQPVINFHYCHAEPRREKELSSCLRAHRVSAVQRRPANRNDPGSGCRDKDADRKSCNKLIEFCFDSYLPCANLYSSRFAGRLQTRRAQALELNASGVMNSSADSGGGIDESWTALYLSRTRQGDSTISKERRHWLTRQWQHEMRERSLL
jgi:hypothetical protein